MKYDFSVRKVEEFVRNLNNEEKNEKQDNQPKVKFPALKRRTECYQMPSYLT